MLIKIIAVTIYTVAFLALVTIEIWDRINDTSFAIVPLLYWLVLVGWAVMVAVFKWKGGASLRAGFVLFVFGAFFAIISMEVNAEVLMRVGFISFLTGMVQALVEHKKNEN